MCIRDSIVDAPIYDKKLKRLKVLENHTDPQEARALKLKKTSSSFDLPYKATLQLPDKADQARLVAFVSTDGCGECSSVDTIEVAAISNPASLLKGDEMCIRDRCRPEPQHRNPATYRFQGRYPFLLYTSTK